MGLPNTTSLASYGGAKNDFSAPIDSSTDRSATGVNPAYNDIAAMTHTAFRVWAHLTLYSNGAAPTIVARDEMWNNGLNNGPVVARVAAGQFSLTYPTTVLDEIPPTSPGYSGPQAVNLLGGIGQARCGVPTSSDWADVKVFPTAPNVLMAYFWHQASGGMTLGDPSPSSIDIDVFGR